MAKLKGKIAPISPLAQIQQLPSISSVQNQIPNVNLPQLSFPQFNRDITIWNAFYQLFNTLIVANQTIECRKTNLFIILLNNATQSKPIQLLHMFETLQLTDFDITIAIDTLK